MSMKGQETVITVRECKVCHQQWSYAEGCEQHECTNCKTSASDIIGRVKVQYGDRGYRVLHEVFDPEIEGEGI